MAGAVGCPPLAGRPCARSDAEGSKAASGDAVAMAVDGAIVPAVELGPRPEPLVVKGVLRLDNKRALAVSFVVPYADEKAKGYEGRGGLEATGAGGGPAPGKGKPVSLAGEGAPGSDAAKVEGGTNDAAKAPSGTSEPGAGSKTGEPSIKLGGSGGTGTSTGSGKKGEASLTLGGSRSRTKSTGATETEAK